MKLVNEFARLIRRSLLIALAMIPAAAMADSGAYIGASYGNASIDFGLDVPGFSSDFDEDDSGYKLVLGYRFDLPSVFLAVEGGYVDLGSPKMTVATETLIIDPTGVNLFGVAGLEAGPAELYLKAGYIAWDADITVIDDLGNSISGSDDGSDMGYGLGVSVGVGPIAVRGEYEVFDIDDADASMISLGFTYQFD